MQETDTLLTVPNRYTAADDATITNMDTKPTSTLKKLLLIIGFIGVILFGAYAYKNYIGPGSTSNNTENMSDTSTSTSTSSNTPETDNLVKLENDDSLLIHNLSDVKIPDGKACVDLCLEYCPFIVTLCTELCEDGSFCVDFGLTLCSSEPINAYCEMQ